MQLLPDQILTVEKIRAAYRAGFRSPLLVSPTGSGKTVMFSFITKSHVEKQGRVMILVHRQELVDQVSETLTNVGVQHGFMVAGHHFDRRHRVMVGSVQTVVRRLADDWQPTLIIVDEAHHCIARTAWGRVLSHYRCHALGVTATPCRMSGEGLGEIFDTLVMGPTTQELIDAGRLSPFRIFCPSVPDLSDVHRRMGEFVQADLTSVMDKPSITGDAIEHYTRLGAGKQAVCFCVSVEHARHMSEAFKERDIPAYHLSGDLSPEWRRDIVRDFRDRKIRVLTSCDLISEGFDVPGIEVGICLRPTQSLALWLQQVGRCLRTAHGKSEAIILDHAGNALRHGLPTDAHIWSLDGGASISRKDEAAQSVRICPKCWAANKSRSTACASCGHGFETKPRKVASREGDLKELTAENLARLRVAPTENETKQLAFLTELGRKRGFQNPEGWARHVLAGQRAKVARKVRTGT